MKFHQLLALVGAASFGVDDESYNDILHAFLTSDYEEEEVVINFRSDISGQKRKKRESNEYTENDRFSSLFSQ